MDIYISYKKDYSAHLANNFWYRLDSKGYSVFYDTETLRKDDWEKQLYANIDDAKDIIILIHPQSFGSCNDWRNKESKDYLDDVFCQEILYALEKGKNIIPILTDGATLDIIKDLPPEFAELHKKQSPKFVLEYINSFIDKLTDGFLTALQQENKIGHGKCLIKFYSEIDCQIFYGSSLVGLATAFADDPIVFQTNHFGQYRFKIVEDSGKAVYIEKEILLNQEINHLINKPKTTNYKMLVGLPAACLVTGILFCLGYLLGAPTTSTPETNRKSEMTKLVIENSEREISIPQYLKNNSISSK